MDSGRCDGGCPSSAHRHTAPGRQGAGRGRGRHVHRDLRPSHRGLVLRRPIVAERGVSSHPVREGTSAALYPRDALFQIRCIGSFNMARPVRHCYENRVSNAAGEGIPKGSDSPAPVLSLPKERGSGPMMLRSSRLRICRRGKPQPNTVRAGGWVGSKSVGFFIHQGVGLRPLGEFTEGLPSNHGSSEQGTEIETALTRKTPSCGPVDTCPTIRRPRPHPPTRCSFGGPSPVNQDRISRERRAKTSHLEG